MSPFIARFTGNVCRSMAASLKGPEPLRSVRIALEGDRVSIEVDGTPVPLDATRGFAGVIVRDTFRGMLSHLRDVDAAGALSIEVELEEKGG